jgi:hypothetical protein
MGLYVRKRRNKEYVLVDLCPDSDDNDAKMRCKMSEENVREKQMR